MKEAKCQKLSRRHFFGAVAWAVLGINGGFYLLNHGWPTWLSDLGNGEKLTPYPQGMGDNRSRRLPTNDPYGNPWPSAAGYLLYTPVLNHSGRSTITIDNGNGSSAVQGQLIDENRSPRLVVRQFFIPAREQFTLHNLTAGDYQLRFHDLSTGEIWELSQPRKLEEIDEGTQIRASRYVLILHSLHGNVLTKPVSWRGFNGQ